MSAALIVTALLLGSVPPELSDPAPGALLRWPRLELLDERSGLPSDTLDPENPLRFSMTGPGIVRLRGHLTEGCEPVAFRRSSAGPGWIDLPLKTVRDGADSVLEVTPALVPGIGDEETEPPTLFRVTLPPGCEALPLEAFRAAAEVDEYGAMGLGVVVRRWAKAPPPLAEVKELLGRTLPRRWQEAVALAAALPHLLGGADGHDAAVEDVSRAWLEDAISEAQADELSFAFVSPLPGSGPSISIAGSPQPFFRLGAGQTWEAEVGSATVLRLFARTEVDEHRSVVVQNAQLQFDERPAVSWRAATSRDPEAAGFTRQRSLNVVIPAGVKRVRLRAVDSLLLRGLLLRRKVHLEDAFSVETSSSLLARAATEEQPNLPSRLAVALAQAQLGRPESLRRLLRRPELRGVAAALAALIAAETSTDDAIAADLLGRAEAHLASPKDELERLVGPLLEARVLRARMRALVGTDRASEAVRGWLGFAGTRPLTSEDAAALAEVDAVAAEGLESGAPVLAVLDGLSASRPLDKTLLVARSREYALATGWYSLGLEGNTQEFLEPPPQARPMAPERFAYAQLPRGGEALSVVVPVPPLPNRKPVLSFVVARGTALARLITVQLDGVTISLPALSSFEQLDLPVAPGKHTVALQSLDFAGEVFANYAIASDASYLRRYGEVGAHGLEWRSREVGSPEVAELSIRLVGSLTTAAPGDFDVTLDGVGEHPVTLRLHPGPWRTEPNGDLPPGSVVTSPLEVTFPVSHANAFHLHGTVPKGVRLLARLSLRRHRPAIPPVVDPEAVNGAGVAVTNTGAALSTVTELTSRIAAKGSAPVHSIARAAILFELDELALAREDLLAAVEDRSLGAYQRALVTALWRGLDAIGSAHPASVPSGVEQLTPALLLAAGHPDAVGIGLLALLDDPAALGRATPPELRSRVGGGAAGDLAVMMAAHAADQAGDLSRAASLWTDLARAHPDLALLRRSAGEALLRSPDPKASVLAYLELSAACELEPRDAYAHRLLRRAAARTRLRPLKLVEQSAGTRGVLISGGETMDPTVEEAMLPPTPGAERSTLLTTGRQARLSLSLNEPMELRLRAQVLELRSRELSLLGRERPGVEYVRDGEPPVRFECSAEGSCRSEAIKLGAGVHVLETRLVGGLRPAGRLWADAKRERAPKRPASSEAFAAAHISDHLVATTGEPLSLLVHGPALLRVEARSRLGQRAAREAELVAKVQGQPALTRSLSLAHEADPRALLEDHSAISRASLTTLSLPEAMVYRVTVRPRTGELFVRISARDAGGPLATDPMPTLAYRSLTPPPAFPVPGIEDPLLSHIVEGDVDPGLDGLGSFALSTRWLHEQFDDAGAQFQPTNALDTSFAYRALASEWLTFKLSGGLRVPTLGATSERLGAEVFFMHPALRVLRGQLTLDGWTQLVGNVRAWSGAMKLMVEPILTLTSGLHLVSKLGTRFWLSTLSTPSEAMLASVDPSLSTRYTLEHPRSLFWEEGLEAEPLANLVVYANARVKTNQSMSPIDLDHVSTGVFARALFGRTFAETALRSSWFLADGDRRVPYSDTALFLTVSHTVWLSGRQYLELRATGGYHFQSNAPEISILIGWEWSNGRRFRDHTPLEGEDYFFPQRGPGRESGRVEVRR